MRKTIILAAAAAMLISAPSLAVSADDWGSSGDASWGKAEEAKPAVQTTADGKQCGLDDERLANIVPVLQDVRAGKKIQPLKITFGSYMDMTVKVREILGDNIIITAPNCKDQPLFEGELTSKVIIPFPYAFTLINQALQEKDIDKLKFIFKNAKAEPATANEIMNFSMAQAYPIETGKVLAGVANVQPILREKQENEIGIVVLSLYKSMGGSLAKGENPNINIYTWGGEKEASTSAVSTVYDDGSKHKVTVSPVYLYVDSARVPVTSYNRTILAGLYRAVGVNPVFTRVAPK